MNIAVLKRDTGLGLGLAIIAEEDFDAAQHVRHPMLVQFKCSNRVGLIDERDYDATEHDLGGLHESAFAAQRCADRALARQAAE